MRLLCWLLKLYPRAWRERYEIEMVALLEEHNVTLFTLLDLLLGALDARLNPLYREQRVLSTAERTTRLRAAHSTMFWVFPAFWICWIGFLSDLSDALWYPLSRTHPLIAVANTIMGMGFDATLLVAVLTGILIALVTARRTLTEKHKGIYLLPLACFLCTCVCYFVTILGEPQIGWVFLLSLLGSLVIISLVLAKGKLSKELLSLSFVPTTIATLGMVVQLIAVAMWGIALFSMSSTIKNPLWSANGGFTLLTGFLVMAVLTLFALRTLIRGLLALTSTISPLKEETQQPLPPLVQ